MVNSAELPLLIILCQCGQLLRLRPKPTDTVSNSNQGVEVDHYKVLGLVPPVTDAQVKSAHRERVKVCHPDRGGDPEEFHAVTIAYETLIDAEKRRAYDQQRAGARGAANASVTAPDLVGQRTKDVASTGESIRMSIRVMLVPVPKGDPRGGRVIGQLPTPGSRVPADVPLLLVLAVANTSALWMKVKAYAVVIGNSFVSGFSRGAGLGDPKELAATSHQSAGASVADSVGEISGALLKGGVGVASCLFRLWAFGMGLILVLILLWAAQPLGVIALVILLWLTIRSFSHRQDRKQRGLWY